MEYTPKAAPTPFVIFVDDSLTDAQINTIAIKQIYPLAKVLHFDNGASAISYWQNRSKEEPLPDMMLIDMNMPLMTGIEVLEALQRDLLKIIPTYIYSGTIDPKEISMALKAGGDGFFEKPNDFNQAVRFFEQVLQPILAS